MARISEKPTEKPTLVIPRRDRATGTVKPKVICTVHFNDDELGEMKKGKRYKLTCTLWGADSLVNGDDDMVALFSSKTFPKHNPTGKNDVKVTFEENVALDRLDEDDGTDDIIARVRLLNLSIQDKSNRVVDHKTTNEVQRDF